MAEGSKVDTGDPNSEDRDCRCPFSHPFWAKRTEQLATTAGFHLKLYVTLPIGNAWTLIDSGATNNFMNPRFVRKCKVPIQRLARIPVTGLDMVGLAQEIEHISCSLPMSVHDHPERIKFNILETGDYDIILGITWLKRHNPDIDWRTGRGAFNRCRCERKKDVNQERPQGLKLKSHLAVPVAE
ncbi:Retrotransposon polyprotein [Penicillium sp. DV-2018c]|nr:Retrotransposon polyprotein [Penicillium sp. DV-2018c]KAJ5571241.1 Retrotransposon polyprotein [Penicillium sp. DV-2018c]